MIICDLHTHSTASDGKYSPKDVVRKAYDRGVKYLALTDHDTLSGIEEAKSEAEKLDMHFIPGVELSTTYKGETIHILGYFIDENNEKLSSVLYKLKEARKKKFFELVDYVEKRLDLKINRIDVENIVNKVNVPGKPHLAELLVKYNYASSVREAFEKYLEDAKTKTSNRAPADEVIDAIKSAGGIAIWAHPKKVEKQYNISFEELMPRLLELGIDGIEIFNSLHSYDDCCRYLDYSNKNNLFKTGGSDYHGDQVKPDVKIGVLYNSGEEIKIDLKQINLQSIIKEEK